jgi:hypothetical protein
MEEIAAVEGGVDVFEHVRVDACSVPDACGGGFLVRNNPRETKGESGLHFSDFLFSGKIELCSLH